MIVLVINCGSSSVKLALFQGENTEPLATGMVDRVGAEGVSGSYKISDGARREVVCPAGGDHAAVLDAVLSAMREDAALGKPEVAAIGHRVVHGGQEFAGPVRLDGRVLKTIRDLALLAPVHAVPNALGIEATLRLFPDLPQVAVFDTAFHQTIPPHVFRYAIPEELYTHYAIRRYGFHGTSHEYVAAEAVQRLGLEPETARVLTAHLGNGCSATAVLGGRSVDSSMGLTPLEGLVMGTRSGNVDPNLHHFLCHQTGMTLEEITDLLNKRSGLLGLSGISNDMREVTAASEQGNPAARLAIEVFCFRLARELGGLAVSLGGPPQALVFTGGIGENSPMVRKMTLSHLALFRFELDPARNATIPPGGVITQQESTGPVALVVSTREEFAIARAVRDLIAP